VVVVSTEGSEARRAALESLGVSFIRKPFKPEELRGLVLRATGVTPDDEYYAPHAAAAAVDDGALDF
jgi:DNA-binding response OmpR family regulator